MAKRDYKQFCPTARALNVVGERWTLLIVRDLLIRPRRYSEIRRGMPGMASNLLAQRLAEMEEVGLIEKRPVAGPSPHDVYALTDRGRDLEPILVDLARFGFPLLGVPTDTEPMVDERAELGLRAMMVDEEMPDHELTIRFALAEGRYLVTIAAPGPRGARLAARDRVAITRLEDDGAHPSGAVSDADVVVRGSMVGLLWIRQKMMTLAEAERDGILSFDGRDDSVAAVRYLYRLDPVAV